VCKFFRQFNTGDFANKDLRGFGNVETGEFSNRTRGLTDDLRVQHSIRKDNLADLDDFFGVEEVATTESKFLLDNIVHRIGNNNRLFGGANKTIVECLRMNDGIHCVEKIGAFMNQGWNISCADTDRGFATGVGGLNHSWTTCGQDTIGKSHSHS